MFDLLTCFLEVTVGRLVQGQVERIELAKDGGAPCIHVRLGALGAPKMMPCLCGRRRGAEKITQEW